MRIVHHPKNRGYGGALRSGFATATKDYIFYTDGDAQYDPAEMTVLWAKMTDDVDWVNGYKISRSDPLHRIIIGRVYHHIVKMLFGLKVRDVDCDFRLMRRRIFDVVRLEKNSGVICLEMMKKFQDAGFRVAEVPVHHYHRAYGKSQFFNFPRIFRTAIDVMKLWWALVIRRSTSSAARGSGRRAASKSADDRESFYRGRHVMITGGLGFIGSNLARRLVDLGADVLLVDSLIPDYGGNLFNIAGIEDRVTVNVADVRQASTMNYLVQGREVIFNLAGQVSHIDSLRDPHTDLDINCRSQLTLLEACRHHNPRAKVVYASTRQIYGKPDALPGHRTASRAADRRQRHQQGRRRVLPPGLQQRVRRPRVRAAADQRLRAASAAAAQPPGLHRLVHPPRARGPGNPGLRRRLAGSRLRLRGRRRRGVPAPRAPPTT